MITLTPAYGRDYRNKAEVAEALSTSDWILNDHASRWNGLPCFPSRDLAGQTVKVRYGKLRKLIVHTFSKEASS